MYNNSQKIQNVREWYLIHYKCGAERNNLLKNRGVLFQTLALEFSVIKAFEAIERNIENSMILDIGCGSGGNLYQLTRLGIKISNISGVDIRNEEVDKAKILYPNAFFSVSDATQLPFKDNSFDIVTESTMYATLTDDKICCKIAEEMIRVCKVDGYIMLIDWRTPKFWDENYNALTKYKLWKFFLINNSCTFKKKLMVP